MRRAWPYRSVSVLRWEPSGVVAGLGMRMGRENNDTINNNNNFVNNSNRQNINNAYRATAEPSSPQEVIVIGNAIRSIAGARHIAGQRRTGSAVLLEAIPFEPAGNACQNQARQQPAGGYRRMGNRQPSGGGDRGAGTRDASNCGAGGYRGAGTRDTSNRSANPATRTPTAEVEDSRRQSTSPEFPERDERSAFGGAFSGMSGSGARAEQFAWFFQHGRLSRRRFPRRRWRSAEVGRNHDHRGKYEIKIIDFRTAIGIFAIILVAPCCMMPGLAVGQVKSEAQTVTTAPKAFDSPQQAAEALINASGAYDVPELMAIFGRDGKDFVASADPVEDKNNAAAFATEARAENSTSIDPAKPTRAIIIVGEERWPMPVPLIKKNGKRHSR